MSYRSVAEYRTFCSFILADQLVLVLCISTASHALDATPYGRDEAAELNLFVR